MAVAVIVLLIISIFAVSVAIFSFQPAAYQLTYKTPYWQSGNVHPEMSFAQNTIYEGTIWLPIIAIAIAGIWAFLSISRRDDI